jgi:hypothetical protein
LCFEIKNICKFIWEEFLGYLRRESEKDTEREGGRKRENFHVKYQNFLYHRPTHADGLNEIYGKIFHPLH